MGLVLAVKVLNNPRADRIRLSGIDCPEKGQAFGKQAKHAGSELAYGKEVTLQTFGKDKYHRTMADLILPEGTNVNRARDPFLTLAGSRLAGSAERSHRMK
jgi:endonuclease YncB( thermonuclease family)